MTVALVVPRSASGFGLQRGRPAASERLTSVTTMSRGHLRQLDRQIERVIAPVLVERGFDFDGRRTFRRAHGTERGPVVQLVSFQVGVRSLAGRFTVNLGVFVPWLEERAAPGGQPETYDCLSDLTQRLGFFHRPQRGFVSRLLGRHPEPRDHWWAQHSDPDRMSGVLADVRDCLLDSGLPWLEAHSQGSAISAAKEALEARKRERGDA
jgi:hypothetical protein